MRETDPVSPKNFVQKIESVKSENSFYSFYKASVDISSNYYICGYGYKAVSFAMYMTIGEYSWIYDWYRVDDLENIQQTINGKELTHVLVVFDAMIERDIINGTEYNAPTKYYYEQNIEKLREPTSRGNKQEYILYLRTNLIDANTTPLISSSVKNDGYPVYTDESGVEYLSFVHEEQQGYDGKVENCSKTLFLEYYDILSPYFVPLNQLESSYTYNDKLIIQRYAGINLEILNELLIK